MKNTWIRYQLTAILLFTISTNPNEGEVDGNQLAKKLMLTILAIAAVCASAQENVTIFTGVTGSRVGVEGLYSGVVAGENNEASGLFSSVGGGMNNIARLIFLMICFYQEPSCKCCCLLELYFLFHLFSLNCFTKFSMLSQDSLRNDNDIFAHTIVDDLTIITITTTIIVIIIITNITLFLQFIRLVLLLLFSGVASSANGNANTAEGGFSVVAGGAGNSASFTYAGVFAGHDNAATGYDSIVLGGNANTASVPMSAIITGSWNSASGQGAIVLTGFENQALGENSVVIGGEQNVASGKNSVALGTNARATHDHSVVLALGPGACSSEEAGQLTVCAKVDFLSLIVSCF
jgi:hypothetical protein